jgi:steroid 5-alpha reductase family enzyme
MWILVAVAIELMALVGVVSVLATRRTHAAFVLGFNTMAFVTGIFVWHFGLSARAVVVLAMVVVYLVRMNWVLFVWSGQTALGKLDNSPMAGKLVIPIVLANTVGWAYCLPLYFAVRSTSPLGPADLFGVGLYIIGTVFHFGADYQKRRFKFQHGSEGHLLDTGFWALCRHPNYFGDFLIYVSFAVMGQSFWGLVAPLLNALQYAFDAIPKSEKWAAERYGAAWEAYRAKVKAFVPYVV